MLRGGTVIGFVATLLAWAHIVFLTGVASPGDWWFEDDPTVVRGASEPETPLGFFAGESSLAHGSGQNATIALLLTSHWLDSRISRRDAAVSYAHSAVSYLATALALFWLASRLLRSAGWGFAVALIWMVLPSTLSVVENLSARHYLEGMFFALLACACAEALVRQPAPGRRPLVAALAGSMLMAMLFKELYVASLPLLLFAWLAWARRWTAVAAVCATSLAYAGYRIWLLGISTEYFGLRLLTLGEYGEYLTRLPYVLTANWGGFAIAAAAVVAFVVALRSGRLSRAEAALYALLGVSALATVYPVAIGLYEHWRIPGTWHRSAFVVNLVAIFAAARALRAAGSRRLTLAAAVAAVVALSIGTKRTVRHWDGLKKWYTAEGRFMLDHPGELLYSNLPAGWFLPTLRQLYPERRGADVVSIHDPRPMVVAAVSGGRRVWRYVDPAVVPVATPRDIIGPH